MKSVERVLFSGLTTKAINPPPPNREFPIVIIDMDIRYYNNPGLRNKTSIIAKNTLFSRNRGSHNPPHNVQCCGSAKF